MLTKLTPFPLRRLLLAACLCAAGPAAADLLTLEVQGIAAGHCLSAEWTTGIRHIKLPVMVCRRTPEQLAALGKTAGRPDPRLLVAVQKTANAMADSRLPSQIFAMQQRLDGTSSRSLRDEFFVAIELEPFIGCQLQTEVFASQTAALRNPCHGNEFDSNGRPWGDFDLYPQFFLQIPPHHWQDDKLIVGELPPGTPWQAYELREAEDIHWPVRNLLSAAAWGDTARLAALVRDRRNPVAIDAAPPQHSEHTALLVAVSRGQREAVRWLLENGANPHVESRYGTPILEIAEIVGDPAIVELLKQHGAGPKLEEPALQSPAGK